MSDPARTSAVPAELAQFERVLSECQESVLGEQRRLQRVQLLFETERKQYEQDLEALRTRLDQTEVALSTERTERVRFEQRCRQAEDRLASETQARTQAEQREARLRESLEIGRARFGELRQNLQDLAGRYRALQEKELRARGELQRTGAALVHHQSELRAVRQTVEQLENRNRELGDAMVSARRANENAAADPVIGRFQVALRQQAEELSRLQHVNSTLMQMLRHGPGAEAPRGAGPRMEGSGPVGQA